MTSPVAAIAKPELRKLAMARRDAMGADARRAGSVAIAARLAPLVEAARPAVLAGYLPIRTEVDLGAFLEGERRQGRAIALPAVVDAATMVFRRYMPDTALDTGSFGTRMPTIVSPEVVPDLVLLPMVAFDRSGTRLGHGKGYYDRALAALPSRPVLIGVAFAVQEVAMIPHQPHDVRLDWIVTERETIDLRGRAA
ncbi:MAG TPA: 5-formyltetrahydrofolate cyclo-ligase [Bauldia sp.]|nr:5-formyltetrahydrofolate cyclo-ligase [Bauldia sp.]